MALLVAPPRGIVILWVYRRLFRIVLFFGVRLKIVVLTGILLRWDTDDRFLTFQWQIESTTHKTLGRGSCFVPAIVDVKMVPCKFTRKAFVEMRSMNR